MLTYLSVRNFAIIENIEVHFNDGMTALTGETGAGKSLLIDAIGLLLGDRASTYIVRTGEDKAIVEGVFTYDNTLLDPILARLDIEQENNELVIRRQITVSNNNIIKVNNTTIPLKDLRLITSKLADIHTQEDTLRLINPMTYLDIVDNFERDQIERKLATYQEQLAAYKKSLNDLKRLENSNDDLLERLDLLRFQVKELTQFNLKKDEKEELEEAIEKLENFDDIFTHLNEAKERLEQTGAIDHIYDAAKHIKNITDFGEDYDNVSKRMLSSYYELEDTFETLQRIVETLDFDPQELDDMQTRLHRLETLEQKYRKSIPELILYLEEIKYDIENIDHYDDVIKDHENQVKKSFKATYDTALDLSRKRQEIAKYIEQELLDILADLELAKTAFDITFDIPDADDPFNDRIFLENGIDVVDFMLSTNVGEPLKPLSRSASGGEMSRIMLGFKNVLAKSLGLSLMIFDEIDTGVSGYIANQVAKKMKQIAHDTQVICITHIPQVAAISKHHIHISKTVEDARTKAHIKILNGEDRVTEIASMISGDNVSDAALKTARELLQ
ncbi:MAG: DNA repair protein RecN [Candidatus Izimaplasma sp.]|nr:DNA repair protein RecN [Candidatus Izimaplasma bacterium]